MDQDDELPEASLQLLEDIYNEIPRNVQYSNTYDLYFAVCQLVSEAMGFKIKKPVTDIRYKPSAKQYLQIIAEDNSSRVRKIRLKKNWWDSDIGPLIVFYKKNLCALLPQSNGSYELIDPSQGTREKLTIDHVKAIKSTAYVFYSTLPKEKLSTFDILKFTFKTLKKEMISIVIFQLFASILMLAVPVLTGIIFDKVIPYSNTSLLLEYALLLFLICLIVILIHLIQTSALLRLRVKAKYKMKVGIWDRLLRLPLSFFREYSAGDLSYRASIVNEIQDVLGTNAIITIISGFMSFVNIGLMIYISGYLSLVAIALVIIIVSISSLFNILILRQKRIIIDKNTTINGILLSLINEILKIRVSHKESTAFMVWNKEFSEKLRSQNIVNKYINGLTVFNVGFMGFSTLIIYSMVLWLGSTITFADFIIFDAAFIQFFSALIALSTVLSESIAIAPLINKSKPIFECKPEEEGHKGAFELDGRIVMKNIVFRYAGNDKPIFNDFNLTIQPGSFTAIVGPSGSGKSTIFRLLLALEHPESGEIQFSGINLNNMQLRNLRSQIGVVMQSTQLIPGTIFENIVGNNPMMSREEAWEIASTVGLQDTINDLPMGIDTLLNDGIQTLSGGEVQRINLARAISSKPKILMLDEATSALDNRVQYQIHQFLKEMNFTRIVIAHRLSTIIHADVIHVIAAGQCVESGSYEELMQAKGLFFRLSAQIH